MIKKLLATAALFWGIGLCAPAHATTYVFSDCGTGAVGGCVVGNDASAGTSVATAFRTSSKFQSMFASAAAGDHLQFCQGGAWNAMGNTNMKNTHTTPGVTSITVESVDCSSIYGGAGAGIRPKLNGTGNGGQPIIGLYQNGANVDVGGYIFKDLEMIGDGSTTTNGFIFAGGTNYITIDNVKITLTAVAIQCQGGTALTSGTGAGLGAHYKIVNSTLSQNYSAAILSGCSDTLIEHNTFTKNGGGTAAGGCHGTLDCYRYHDIYLQEAETSLPPAPSIASLVGNGVTVTMTTASPHGLASGSHFLIIVSGASTNFNVGGVVGTVTGASTITYPASGIGTAGAVGSYFTNRSVATTNVTIRHNTLSEGDPGAAGQCGMAHIVVHGRWTGLLVESNTISESVAPTLNTCIAVEIDSGGYSAPDDFESMTNVIVRNNTCLNLAYCYTLDIAVQALIENNYGWCSVAATGCIYMRAKGDSPVATNDQNPDKVTIRYNTVYLSNPDGSSIGIGLYGNVSDALTGGGHNLYGNAVILGGSGTITTSTQCFKTDNIPAAKFTVRDYNACYYLGSNVPKWDGTQSLATVQGTGKDTNSFLTATTSISAASPGPWLTSSTTGPNIATGSGLKNAGHPTLGPSTSWHGAIRNQGTRDIGAFEFGATLGVVPDSQTAVGAP